MISNTLRRSCLSKERMEAIERSRIINMDMNDIPQYRQQDSKNTDLDALYNSIERGLKRQPSKKTPAAYLTIGFFAGAIFMLLMVGIISLGSMGTKNTGIPETSTMTVAPSKEAQVADVEPTGLAEEKYTIKAGDTLDKIALRFYGKYDSKKIEQIQKINNITNPTAIQIGQVIIIPLAGQ